MCAFFIITLFDFLVCLAQPFTDPKASVKQDILIYLANYCMINSNASNDINQFDEI